MSVVLILKATGWKISWDERQYWLGSDSTCVMEREDVANKENWDESLKALASCCAIAHIHRLRLVLQAT